MRVLFVPYHSAMTSHLIPLLALNYRLRNKPVETAFLAPRHHHRILSKLGAAALEIDHKNLSTELQAYAKYSPDVVVDDLSFSTGFATSLRNVSRITIQRTGMFRGYRPENKAHVHSMGIPSNDAIKDIVDVTSTGLPQPQTLSDLFEAKLNVVPGIKLIESLPPDLAHDPSFIFSGPLIMEDYYFRRRDSILYESLESCRNFDPIYKFIDTHKYRKKVYVTMGIAEPAIIEERERIHSNNTPRGERPGNRSFGDDKFYQEVKEFMKVMQNCLRYMLDREIALLTNIKVENLTDKQQGGYFYGPYLPMNYICSKVDMMIHHCGSGAYHYSILHTVPSITIGTQCYDREEVALRLQELGASTHLPSPLECQDFEERFKAAMNLIYDDDALSRKRERQRYLKTIVEEVSSSFDFESVLRRACA